jgi:hypothetical protein
VTEDHLDEVTGADARPDPGPPAATTIVTEDQLNQVSGADPRLGPGPPSDTVITTAPAEEFRSAADFPASTDVLVPSGVKARARANIAAIELVHTLHGAQRPATLPEQRILAAWSGWGAIPHVFDPRNEDFNTERAHVAGLLTPEQYRRAQASILNAHYTDPRWFRLSGMH